MPRTSLLRSVLLALFQAGCLLASGGEARAQASAAADRKTANPDVVATVVVYNSTNAESQKLAEFYADKRGIPREQMVGIPCPQEEEISRAVYDDVIAEPLRRAFTEKGWWKLREPDDALGPIESNRIRYVVLMRGVPLKIAPAANYAGDKPYHTTPIGEHNEASVDSEISVLSLRVRAISGAINNPYYRSYKSIHEAQRPEIMLVGRLDGPSAAIVQRMIVDSLATEQTGLHGFAYIDARGIATPGLKEGDDWMQNAANSLQRGGMPVILDKGEGLFPEGYPMRNAAIYLGWYSEQPAGSFLTKGFRFRPGAVACHIHSFSAISVRNPQTQWVGPLLNLGAAAVLGNVYEPYLALTPNLDVFTDHLRGGFTFAESAYASQRVLSWMTTFVGDPLYRPFPTLATTPPGKDTAEWDQYEAGAREWFENPAKGEATLKASAQKLKSGVVWEGLGLLQIRASKVKEGIASFDQARKTYANAEDSLRAAIHEAIQLRGAGQETEAVALVKGEAKAHPGAPALNVLRMVVPAAFPAPAKATAPPVTPAGGR